MGCLWHCFSHIITIYHNPSIHVYLLCIGGWTWNLSTCVSSVENGPETQVWHTQKDLLQDGEKGELEYAVLGLNWNVLEHRASHPKIWRFPSMGVPQNAWLIRNNPIKIWMMTGGSRIQETSISQVLGFGMTRVWMWCYPVINCVFLWSCRI